MGYHNGWRDQIRSRLDSGPPIGGRIATALWHPALSHESSYMLTYIARVLEPSTHIETYLLTDIGIYGPNMGRSGFRGQNL